MPTPQGWTVVPEAAPPPAGWTRVDEPTFKTSNKKDAAGNATVGDLALEGLKGVVDVTVTPIWQTLKAFATAGLDPQHADPLGDMVRGIVGAHKDQYYKGKQAFHEGRYSEAAGHFTAAGLPMVGPAAAQAGELIGTGDPAQMARGMGQGVGLVAPFLRPRESPAPAAAASSVPPEIQFAEDRGVPLDAATVSDNRVVKHAQAAADHTIGGSLVATPARAAQAAAMERVGGELADQAHPAVVTPEQAGLSVADALKQKIAGHVDTANAAYDRLRELEQAPGNRMEIAHPVEPGPVDALPGWQKGQLRRIAHEMDAVGYEGRTWNAVADKSGNAGDFDIVAGHAGAPVYHDILAKLEGASRPTRGEVQGAIETYVAGGPETPIARAARAVAEQRVNDAAQVSRPTLPPDAMQTPLRAEAGRAEEIGLPVELASVKASLKPLAEQLRRQMPITQQQANPGLKAIQNILDGPDWAPLSQVDRDLSTIKTLAREHGGLAKRAVSDLGAAVQKAADAGGPEVSGALKAGREATIAKYATTDVLERLHDEPVKTIKALTAPKDSAIQYLRQVTNQVPAQAAPIARAYLEDLLDKPNAVAEWSKLGSETKKILFPSPGHAAALDNFFALRARLASRVVNPSGSGHQAALVGQAAAAVAAPVLTLLTELGAATVAKLLREPAVVQAINRGLSLPPTATAAARSATVLNFARAARVAGVALDTPRAADQQGPRGSSR